MCQYHIFNKYRSIDRPACPTRHPGRRSPLTTRASSRCKSYAVCRRNRASRLLRTSAFCQSGRNSLSTLVSAVHCANGQVNTFISTRYCRSCARFSRSHRHALSRSCVLHNFYKSGNKR